MTAPNQLLRRTVLEISERNTVSQLISLDELHSETAGTVFCDGIISAGIISLSLRDYLIQQIPAEFLYVDIRNSIPAEFELKNRTLILDAHTEDPAEFTFYLQKAFNSISDLSITDIIAATCYTPASLCNIDHEIRPGNNILPLLWQNCNLPEKKLTPNSSVAKFI